MAATRVGIDVGNAPLLMLPGLEPRFFQQLAHRFRRDPSDISQLDRLACQHAHRSVVVSIGDLTTRDGDEMGPLPIGERLASALLPFVCQHGLDASRTKALANVAHRLFRDVQRFGDFGIGPAFIAFQEDSRPRERSGIGFATSYKHLHVVSFVFAEVYR